MADEKLIKAEDLKKAREIDFVRQFTHGSLAKLIEALGVTRRIPMMEGTTLYAYTIEGELESGDVGEGEIIPLSHFEQKKTPVGEMKLKKWRTDRSAEAVMKAGYDTAVTEIDTATRRKAQKEIRTDLFTFLNDISSGEAVDGKTPTEASGNTLQEALADAWGQLQVLFEDDTAEPVYFLNPLDVSKYLAAATITTQTAFGLNYISDFIGLGTVIMNSGIKAGTFIATAKQNIIMYYLTMNGDIARTFDLTTDELGVIGITSGNANKTNATIETTVMSGVQFLVEYAEGVVKGTIGEQ